MSLTIAVDSLVTGFDLSAWPRMTTVPETNFVCVCLCGCMFVCVCVCGLCALARVCVLNYQKLNSVKLF